MNAKKQRQPTASTALAFLGWYLLGTPNSALSAMPTVIERGPHHAVVQTDDDIAGVAPATYTRLETGLHFWDGSQWQESAAEFELFERGVVARRVPHQVILSPSPNNDQAVDVLLPDGQRLRSRVLGLGYYDRASGQSVVIAQVQDCEGALCPEKDEVVYVGAFKGLAAALCYRLTKSSLEQDVLLLEQPLPPGDFGLNSATSELMVITEFFPEKPPTVRSTVVWTETDPALRQALADPDLVDDSIDFGSMRIGSGRAFCLPANEAGLPEQPGPAEGATGEAGAVVTKLWSRTPDGRQVLYEAVAYPAIKAALATLPARQGSKARESVQGQASAPGRRPLPAKLAASPAGPTAMRVAALPPPRRALVLDYTLLNSGQTNYLFKGDETYLVSGTVNLTGTNTTFEGGTVIKFTTNSASKLYVSTPVSWQGSAYRPVVLTARDDQSVGQSITPTNSLSDYYAAVALDLDAGAAGASLSLQHLRVAHAQTALAINGRAGHVLSHVQLVKCQNGLALTNAEASLRNGLFDQVLTNFTGSSSTGRVEHLTVDTATWLNQSIGTNLYLTNCLLVGVVNTNGYSGGSGNQFLSSGSGVFEAVGRGNHYLAAGSPYRNAGVTSLNAALAKELKELTTYPLVVLTSDFTTATTLAPQAQRDSDTPDLGYHYCPLDYCWSGLNLTNTTLLLTNGVAVGVYGTKGTTLRTGAKFVSEGVPNNLNRLVRYAAVQEQPVVWGGSGTSLSLMDYNASSPVPEVRLSFTDASLLAGGESQRVLVDGLNATYNPINPLAIAHSQLRGVAQTIRLFSAGAVVALINNVHERCTWRWDQGYTGYYTFSPFTLTLYHNLFTLGAVTFYYATNTTTWTVKDNLFTPDTLTKLGSYSLTASHNGYRNGLTSLGGASNVVVTNLDFQVGPLGKYYYPTNGADLVRLLDVGSRLASAAGLYHFTTTTNQVKEASSVVDIGYHYVAVDALTGLPLDYDGDGLPDYFEDRDGDGSVDSGETDCNDANDAGVRVWITRPPRNGPLP
jgi:hypothetical protein